MTSIKNVKTAGGRPPKFTEDRRPITVTLPDRIIKLLERVNMDRARALVKCVEATVGTDENNHPPVELVEVLPGKALIVAHSDRTLRKIEWLRMVEIAPARYLLVLPPGVPIERLEVEMRDLIEGIGIKEEEERQMLMELQEMLVQQRRRKTLSKGELLLVDMVR
jgi:hypothetical protein